MKRLHPVVLLCVFLSLLLATNALAQELRRGSSGSGEDNWHPPNPPVKRNHPVGRKPGFPTKNSSSSDSTAKTPIAKTSTAKTARPPVIPITSENEDQVDSAIEKGNAALEAGRFENAEAFYKAAAELDPNDWRPYMGLGNLYWDYGRRFDSRKGYDEKVSLLSIRYEDAVTAYQKAAALKPDEPAIFVALSFIFNSISNSEAEAIKAANQALRLQPNFPEAHFNLGQAYLNTERYNEAMVDFKEAIRLKAQYGKAYHLLGVTYLQLKRLDEAIATYKLGIRTVPGYIETYYALSSAYSDLKRIDESLEVMRQLARSRPTDHEPLQEIGKQLLALRRYDEAIAPLKEAVRLNYHPKVDKYPHTYLAEAYINLNRYDEAIAVLKDIIRIGPTLSPSQDWDRLAFAYNQSERYAEAVEAAQQSIRLHDDVPSPFNSLAYALNQLGRYEEGITAAKRALALSPKFGNPHSHIAFAYLKTGRLNEALTEVKQAVELAPRYSRAHYTLGLVYLALKNKALAVEAQKTLQGLDPKLAQKLLEEINR